MSPEYWALSVLITAMGLVSIGGGAVCIYALWCEVRRNYQR